MSRQLKEITESDAVLFYIGSLLQEISSSEVELQEFITVMENLPDCNPMVLSIYTQIALNIETEMWKSFEGFEKMVEH